MRNVITATEGHILTDGHVYGKVIYLAEGVDVSTFYEITKEEYREIIGRKEAERINN